MLWSIANISTWEFTGYNMIIFFSALQAIPQEIYESGRLDGLSEMGIALRLKLPLIRAGAADRAALLDHRHAATLQRADDADRYLTRDHAAPTRPTSTPTTSPS